ncbi:hypothetical protein ACQEVZ_46615 [Dactylosporangium sp. CA-152071]|uniref:hypothetical protein n=1 Tax=Dactylosporangium sp. CA-152071 TaxID=3239933 RepID=UPI003D8BE032
MLASLLPGLRTLRAPLAAGYVTLFASWLAVADHLRTKANTTGVLADLYALAEKAGAGPTLAAVTFVAYVTGIVLIEVTQLALQVLRDFVSVVYELTPYRLRPAADQSAERLLVLSPGGASQRTRIGRLRAVVLRQLSLRFAADETFRSEMTEHLSALQRDAQRHGRQLPPFLASATAAELIAAAVERGGVRVRLLGWLVDDGWHAERLDWEYQFIGGSAAATPVVSEERDRGRAEAEFRLGLVLPVMWLVTVLAYRDNPWWLLGAVVPAGLLYLGGAAYAKADVAILRAVAEGTISWPAAERLATDRIRIRPPNEILRPATPPTTTEETPTADPIGDA